jgi:hypothetical protein
MAFRIARLRFWLEAERLIHEFWRRWLKEAFQCNLAGDPACLPNPRPHVSDSCFVFSVKLSGLLSGANGSQLTANLSKLILGTFLNLTLRGVGRSAHG